MSPLANLIQSIHLPSHRFLLLTHPSAQSPTKIELRLFAYPPSSRPPSPTAISENGTGNDTGLLLWVGEMDLEEEDGERDENVLASAINEGYLHVDAQLHGSKELNLVKKVDLKILPPDRDPLTFRLKSQPSEIGLQYLFNASLDLLARPKPSASSDKSGLRALRAQISQKDAEIAILSTKLASAKATVVRATAADNINKKKTVVSPMKKAPANASTLQPNAKRRKVVEDDFAGSDDD